VKGKPGQLTKKQVSRRSAKRSWAGGGSSRSQKRTPHRSFLDFHIWICAFWGIWFPKYRDYFIFCFMYIWKVFWYFVKIFI